MEKKLYRFLKHESSSSGILNYTKRQLAEVAVELCTKVKQSCSIGFPKVQMSKLSNFTVEAVCGGGPGVVIE